jgi:phytoene synthase
VTRYILAMDDLDPHCRAVDPDRWTATRFVSDVDARTDCLILIALNHELARAVEVASNPLMAQIRLTWWREALEDLEAGKVRAHPLISAIDHSSLSAGELIGLVEGRYAEPEAIADLDLDDLAGFVDKTAGCLAALTSRRLDPASCLETVVAAARAYGLRGLVRANRLPNSPQIGQLIKESLVNARTRSGELSVSAFPAIAYATLARSTSARLSDLERRARITLAVATGRI